jgi:hypothetical protein
MGTQSTTYYYRYRSNVGLMGWKTILISPHRITFGYPMGETNHKK